jgi:hypothetical protein
MLQKIWSDDFVIHNNASIILDRQHAPQEKDAFQEPIERYDLCDVE